MVFNILLLLTVSIPLQAQHIVFLHDYRMDTLIQRNIAKNIKDKGIPGYRIQIYSGSNRQVANQLKSQFLQAYPDIRAYMTYSQPYFKIRVGDFRTRMDAYTLFYFLKQDERFKTVMIVPDIIELPDLK